MKQPQSKKLKIGVIGLYGDYVLQFEFSQLIGSSVHEGGLQVLICRLEDGRTHEIRTMNTVFIEELKSEE